MEEETIGNRMSIPGRRGHRGLGEVEEWEGDDPENRGEDHGHMDAPYRSLFDVMFILALGTQNRRPSYIFRGNLRVD